MSHLDGAACDAAFLSGAALAHRAVQGASEHLDPSKGVSGEDLAAVWSDLLRSVLQYLPDTIAASLSEELTDDSIQGTLPAFSHTVFVELANFRAQHLQLEEGISAEKLARLRGVADTTAGAWLDAMPVSSNCCLGDGDVARYATCLEFLLLPCRIAL